MLRASDDLEDEYEIRIKKTPRGGQDIRSVGSDISRESLVLPEGTRLDPPEMGLLAAVGAEMVTVHKRPKVGLLSTGNELQDPTDRKPLRKGSVWDSNKTTLIALLHQSAAADIVECGIASDDPQVGYNPAFFRPCTADWCHAIHICSPFS